MPKLNLGDIIYYETCFGISKQKIDRVTDKRAFIGNNIFKREYEEGCRIETIPRRSTWDTGGYYPSSDELEKKWLLELVQSKVKELKFDNIDIKILKNIAENIGVKNA